MKAWVLTVVVALAIGCGGEEASPEVIAREEFIATWVDLRSAAARSRLGVLSASERERVLGEHGVTEEDLLGFVETHGGDPRFMVDVWTEVEALLRSPPPADTTALPPG